MPIINDTAADETTATPALTAPDFFICTSPEMDALERAAADGKHGRHYKNNEQDYSRSHQIPGSSHYVRLELTGSEQSVSPDTGILEKLTLEQDADSALAFLYIARLLAPPSPLPAHAAATGKIDFDDVISKIGWDPRTTTERREMHRRLFQFILFGERAQVVGQRRGIYKDKHTGKEIPTTIRSALWRIVKTETPDQQSLYPELDVPVRVDLVISREWTDLLTQPQTAQYLPMGELLGAIPGNKPSGAWARVIGLALASFWRRLPRESLDGTIKPTRRELLERYPPKTGSVQDVLNSVNPARAITYWHGGLQLLVRSGFIKNTGEADRSVAEIRASLPTQNWAQKWLDERVDIQPCADLHEAMTQRALAIPKSAMRKGAPRKKKTPAVLS